MRFGCIWIPVTVLQLRAWSNTTSTSRKWWQISWIPELANSKPKPCMEENNYKIYKINIKTERDWSCVTFFNDKKKTKTLNYFSPFIYVNKIFYYSFMFRNLFLSLIHI